MLYWWFLAAIQPHFHALAYSPAVLVDDLGRVDREIWNFFVSGKLDATLADLERIHTTIRTCGMLVPNCENDLTQKDAEALSLKVADPTQPWNLASVL